MLANATPLFYPNKQIVPSLEKDLNQTQEVINMFPFQLKLIKFNGVTKDKLETLILGHFNYIQLI